MKSSTLNITVRTNLYHYIVKNARTVCIIDDDNIFHTILKVKISKKDLADKFINFDDGSLAMDFFEKEENWQIDKLPDVIFLDINMPVMNGWQFLESFSAIQGRLLKKPRIFILSSSVDDRDIARAKSHEEVSDFITKPISDEHLEKIFWKEKK
jgi:CheY-like chemotaxis protein